MTRIIIVVLAILSGGATWLFLSLGTASVEQSATDEAPQVITRVLVYARDLPRGTRLTNDVYRWEERQPQNIPADAFSSVETDPAIPASVQRMLLRTNVLSGDIVRPTQLVSGVAGFLSLALSPNMRAVAIRVTSDKIAGGFILPEDRVDVVHTVVRDIDGDGVSNGVSQTILRSVRVLAIGETPTDQTVTRTAEQQDALSGQAPSRVLLGDTVTLEVSEEQARVLFSAAASGTLTLTLLALEDHVPAQVGDISTISEVISTPTEAPAAQVPTPIIQQVVTPTAQSVDAQSVEMPRVTIISGGQSITIEVPASETGE